MLPSLDALQGAKTMHHALFAHGWNVGKDGLPCNQEELAYTLLTFHYVSLRGLRKLGLGLRREDEEAYLHAWNVMGHVLGIRDDLMAHTMEDAEALFKQIQARGRADPFTPDPRPKLGRALMQTMEQLIPMRVAKPLPKLLTRHLCGRATASDIGIDGEVSWLSKTLFVLGLADRARHRRHRAAGRSRLLDLALHHAAARPPLHGRAVDGRDAPAEVARARDEPSAER